LQHKEAPKTLGLTPHSRIPPPRSKECLRTFDVDRELWYIPDGFEVVKKIVSEITVKKQKYLAVCFKNFDPDIVYVPQCLMQYYFPLETLLKHVKKNAESQEKLCFTE
jgi:hypothetical protein